MGEVTVGDELDESDELELDDDPDLTRPAPQSWHRRTAIEMIVSGLVGLYASFVLAIEAWVLAADPDAVFSCDISSVLSCGDVARSWQAQLLGFPNAFLGILFEAIVLTISIATLAGVRFPRWYMLGAQTLYSIGLLFALWLFTQSYFVIGALCPWCLLITVTTTLVWAGLTRMNVRDGNIPAPAWARRFVASGNDWFVTTAFLLVLAAMIVLKYGSALLG
jgi:uncharacterized membrane protein